MSAIRSLWDGKPTLRMPYSTSSIYENAREQKGSRTVNAATKAGQRVGGRAGQFAAEQIGAEIELCGSVFGLGDDESLDGAEANGAERDRVERRRGDVRLRKDHYQPQRLDKLAFAAIAHAGFQQSQAVWRILPTSILGGLHRQNAQLEPERPKVDRSILEFVKSHKFHAADFVIRSDGVCRLNPAMARQVAERVCRAVHWFP
jgi:hypothetical protein